jgi:hypothetical protein
MRAFGRLAVAAIVSSLFVWSAAAHADAMDPALARLVKAPACTNPSGPQFGKWNGFACVPDDDAFVRIINQYGFAFAPPAMYPARTTGYGGFQFALQANYTTIDNGADYWKFGTRGPADPSTGQYSYKNEHPDSVLQVYNVNVRKGLPFGFEVAANVGFMAKTSLVSAGADVRWALLEGFRTGVLGFLPDLALGGSVRTVNGTNEFQLTIASGDGMLSKPIPIADASVLTPYVGYQYMRIFGDSGLIDFTPNTDALSLCGYQGQNQPGTQGYPFPDPSKPQVPTPQPLPATGQPICSGGTTANGDFNNTKTFNRTRITRQRVIVGLMYRIEMVVLGGQFSTDVVDPAAANSGATAAALAGVPRQVSFGFQIGTAF